MSEIKKLRFWGTSAGEGVPTPFCRCRVCEYARKHQGKDLRTRSCFRLDEKVMIDIGADFVPQSLKYCEDTFDVEHVLFSHLHNDHYNRELLWLRSVAMDIKHPDKIHLYCSEDAQKEIVNTYSNDRYHLIDESQVEIHPLRFYETYQVGEYKVTPLKGHHHTIYEKNSANYIIEFPSGKKMYYALDSGVFLDETIEYLKNIKLDLLIMECTFPRENTGIDVHFDLTGAKNELDRLYSIGTISRDTVIYLSHICALNMTHDELVEYWNERSVDYKVNIAYDGLSIDKESNMF